MKKYVNAIERRLNMPLEVKARVMSDFSSSIQARRESGQTDDEIYADLGSPKHVARELNEQMKEFTYQKSPWRFACLVVAAVTAVSLLGYLILGFHGFSFSLNNVGSMGVIGGADGPTAVFVATSPGEILPQVMVRLLILGLALFGYWMLTRRKR